MLNPTPCRLCGYDAPGPSCPHCQHGSSDDSLQDQPTTQIGRILDGLQAVPRGLWLLVTTRGVKRFLVPPVLLTLLAFGALFTWSLGLVDILVDAATVDNLESMGLEEGYFKAAVTWLLDKGVATLLAKISGVVLWLVVSSIVALYAFSVVYEAVAGPFLDEIQGRIETSWFGINPRDEIQRPTSIPVADCIKLSLLGAVPALGFLVAGFVVSGPVGWMLPFGAPLCYLALGLAKKDYGLWLWWVLRIESHTLMVSIKASLVVVFLLIIFLPLKFVPVVGLPLFMAVAGFATAITLLDIPFSRREWALTKRLQFLVHNAGAVTAYGGVAGLLFVIPILGPLIMVPAASIGGLWLVVRLDKDSLRPLETRRPQTNGQATPKV
jgi:uncharacterized protein involved in cysteine biosynthesis